MGGADEAPVNGGYGVMVVGTLRSGLSAPATHWGTKQGLPFHRTKGGLSNGGIWGSLNVEVSYHIERSRLWIWIKME